MRYSFKTRGTCSSKIEFDIEDGLIKNVNFSGGCNGNLQGISALVEGRSAEEVIEKCSGIRCGFKETSCPDQLARAVKEALGM